MGLGTMCEEIKQRQRERHDREFARRLERLKQQLLGCCLWAENNTLEACEEEVNTIVSGLQSAYENIYDRGGPCRFSFNGPVCTDCENEVSKCVPSGNRDSHFDYCGVAHIGPTIPILDVSVPGTDHAWGEIICKGSGQIYTIDFWKGGTSFWRCGRDAFGWECNSR